MKNLSKYLKRIAIGAFLALTGLSISGVEGPQGKLSLQLAAPHANAQALVVVSNWACLAAVLDVGSKKIWNSGKAAGEYHHEVYKCHEVQTSCHPRGPRDPACGTRLTGTATVWRCNWEKVQGTVTRNGDAWKWRRPGKPQYFNSWAEVPYGVSCR